MHLNPGQEAAALDIERHVLVAAGAGTGKTRCVVARLLYLLGVPIGGKQIPSERRRIISGSVSSHPNPHHLPPESLCVV